MYYRRGIFGFNFFFEKIRLFLGGDPPQKGVFLAVFVKNAKPNCKTAYKPLSPILKSSELFRVLFLVGNTSKNP